MKRLVLAAAAIALLAGPALAADSKMAMEATMMCRPSMSAEKPMAMMGSKGMVCKTMDTKAMMAGKMGPNTKGMTAEQTDEAWRTWVQQMMLIQSATGTAGGNG